MPEVPSAERDALIANLALEHARREEPRGQALAEATREPLEPRAADQNPAPSDGAA